MNPDKRARPGGVDCISNTVLVEAAAAATTYCCPPGPPGLGLACTWATSRVPSALSTPMSVAGEGIGPGEHAHGDQLHGPLADSGQRAQRVQRGRSGAARCSAMRPAATSRANACRAATRWRTMPSLADGSARRPAMSAALGNSRVQAGKRRFDGLAQFGHQPARQRSRRGHRDLLAEDDARRRLEAIHRPRGSRKPAGGGTGSVAMQGSIQRRVGIQVQRMAQALHQGTDPPAAESEPRSGAVRCAAARSGIAASHCSQCP